MEYYHNAKYIVWREVERRFSQSFKQDLKGLIRILSADQAVKRINVLITESSQESHIFQIEMDIVDRTPAWDDRTVIDGKPWRRSAYRHSEGMLLMYSPENDSDTKNVRFSK